MEQLKRRDELHQLLHRRVLHIGKYTQNALAIKDHINSYKMNLFTQVNDGQYEQYEADGVTLSIDVT